jgi:hypothetical protein
MKLGLWNDKSWQQKGDYITTQAKISKQCTVYYICMYEKYLRD